MEANINVEPLLKEEGAERDLENTLETDTEDPVISRSDEEPFLKQPKILHDRYHIAYIAFYLLGINTMIPWTFFVMADEVRYLPYFVPLMTSNCYINTVIL